MYLDLIGIVSICVVLCADICVYEIRCGLSWGLKVLVCRSTKKSLSRTRVVDWDDEWWCVGSCRLEFIGK